MASETEFDLRELARRYERSQILYRRMLSLICAGLGVLVVVVGVLVSPTIHYFAPEPPQIASTVQFSGAGLIAIGVLAFLGQSSPAVRLSVGPAGIQLTNKKGRIYSVRWTDPKGRIRITDWRGDANRMRAFKDIDFVLFARAPFETPVPLTAVQAMVGEAQRHGVIVSGWNDATIPRVPAQQIRFEVVRDPPVSDP